MKPDKLPKNGFYIYLIINRVNGKIYVGKSKRMYHRCHQYIYDFRERSIGHINDHLYRAFAKYGFENFSMVPWELCRDENHCSERELFWMDSFRSYLRKFGYNLRRDSKSGMMTHPETSKKISENIKRQWRSGIRSGHSEKLKAAWAKKDKTQVGKHFSDTLTKWIYVIHTNDGYIRCKYKTLKMFGLGNILSTYHRSGLNIGICKGFEIERVPVHG